MGSLLIKFQPDRALYKLQQMTQNYTAHIIEEIVSNPKLLGPNLAPFLRIFRLKLQDYK